MLRDRSWASSMMIVSYGAQLAVGLDLGEQDAVRHQLDERGVLVHLVGEPDLPADGLTQRRVQLLGDPLGDGAGGDTAGLGVPDHAADATAQLHADLRDLGGLAGAGLTRDDHDLVIADGAAIVVLLLADGQLLGIADGGHTARAARPSAARPCATSASISARTAARASGLRILRAPSSLRPSRCASRRDSSVRRGARSPRAGALGPGARRVA